MNKLLYLLPLLLILSMPISDALGAYTDNFDSYAGNTKSPWSAGNPWTLTYSSNAYSDCFAGTEVSTWPVPSTSPGALSYPNTYYFQGANNATCFSASHYVRLTLLVNQSLPTDTFTVWDEVATNAGTNSSTYTVTISVCGQTYSGFKLDHSTVYWQKYVETVAATGTCTIYIQLATIMSATPSAVAWQIDNLSIIGGNAIFSNADVFLEQLNTRSVPVNPWYNITQFSYSYAQVNYSSTTPAYTARNLTAPDFYVPLSNAKLLTIYVSGTYRGVSYSYFRSVIPTSTTHQIVYLDDPSAVQVIQYQIQILDFSNDFPQGTEIFVYAAGNTGLKTLEASGYLDSNHLFGAGLVPGIYAVYLVHGSASYTGTLTLSPTNSLAQLTVPQISVNISANAGNSLTCGALWTSPTQITAVYQDTTNTTSSIAFHLYIRNATGSYTITSPAAYVSGPYGKVTYAGSDYANLPTSQGASYYITCTVTNTFGTGVVYPNAQGAGVLGSSGASTAASFPDILSASTVFPGLSNPTGFFGGYGILLAIGAGFTDFVNPVGGFITALFAAYLGSTGWFPASVATIGIVMSLLGSLGVVLWLERRSR